MRIGWLLIILFTLIPIVLWSSMIPLSIRFANVGNSSISIGQLTGLIGMTLFSLSMILSTRLRIFDSLFGGLNRAYIAHHQIGGIAFILLMVHPLSLAVIYLLSSFKDAALFLLPGQDWVVNFGIAGLLSLMGLIIFTYYIDLPYELWRFTHKFLGVSFLFGIIHSYFIPSDISTLPTLRVYMFTLMGLGLAGYIYRTILGRWLVPRLVYTVSTTRKRGDVIELTLTPGSEKTISFYPGQFIFIQFIGKTVSHETHPFSISSAPAHEGFGITAKILGDFTEQLETIPSGTKALIEGPFGRFSPVFVKSQSYLWIAGGIGITPFLSMARSLQSAQTQIDLFYIVRSENEATFLPELIDISKHTPSFRIIPWFTKKDGHIKGEHFLHYTQDLLSREIFVCGPPAMMMGVKRELKRVAVKKSRIHSEEFSID